jgi:hypothetical protein
MLLSFFSSFPIVENIINLPLLNSNTVLLLLLHFFIESVDDFNNINTSFNFDIIF